MLITARGGSPPYTAEWRTDLASGTVHFSELTQTPVFPPDSSTYFAVVIRDSAGASDSKLIGIGGGRDRRQLLTKERTGIMTDGKYLVQLTSERFAPIIGVATIVGGKVTEFQQNADPASPQPRLGRGEGGYPAAATPPWLTLFLQVQFDSGLVIGPFDAIQRRNGDLVLVSADRSVTGTMERL